MSEPELNVEGAEVTLQDVYALFYVLVRQNQQVHPGNKMCFDLKQKLPKETAINFVREGDKLLVWIPEKPKDHKKKSRLYLPTLVTPN